LHDRIFSSPPSQRRSCVFGLLPAWRGVRMSFSLFPVMGVVWRCVHRAIRLAGTLPVFPSSELSDFRIFRPRPKRLTQPLSGEKHPFPHVIVPSAPAILRLFLGPLTEEPPFSQFPAGGTPPPLRFHETKVFFSSPPSPPFQTEFDSESSRPTLQMRKGSLFYQNAFFPRRQRNNLPSYWSNHMIRACRLFP